MNKSLIKNPSLLLKQLDQLKQNCHIKKIECDQYYRFIKIQYHPIQTNSQYDNQTYSLRIDIPNEYPQQAPSIYFQNIIYHLNVHQTTGQIFLSIIKQDWSPYLTLNSIIQFIDSILSEPDINYPSNKSILKQFKQKYGVYLQNVHDNVNKYHRALIKSKSGSLKSDTGLFLSHQPINYKNNSRKSSFDYIRQDQKAQQVIEPVPKNAFQELQKSLHQEQSIQVQEKQIKQNTPIVNIKTITTVQAPAIEDIPSTTTLERQVSGTDDQIVRLQIKLKKINTTISIFMEQCINLQQKIKCTTHPRLKKFIQQQLQTQLNQLEQVSRVSSQIKNALVKRIKSEGIIN